MIKGKAPDDVFLIIQPTIGLKYRNEKDFRFEFIGNFNDKNGTLKFSNVTLKDEGSYTCIFSLFPSETQSRISQLEVPLATCTAAASKPKAEVRWIKGSLEGKVREELKETRHANGTTTTWSTLLGKPGREMNGQSVKCVISCEATKEEILETNIQVHLPENVDIVHSLMLPLILNGLPLCFHRHHHYKISLNVHYSESKLTQIFLKCFL
uniref:Ig-like domain-containing protein n=1 Tax=Oryzias latipes TaxID=8090 RepID=A0A3P9J6X4_ORYLA